MTTLRLHVYDHCPFCIRVDLALGLKHLPYERIVYGYGESLGDQSKVGCYDGDTVLTGKKELPVLEKIDADGNREWLKAESLDIIQWVETERAPPFPARSGRADLAAFFATDGRFKVVQRRLSRPRNLKLTHLRDWARPEDRAYARAKYERGGFDYADAAARDAESRAEMTALLAGAGAALLGSDAALGADGALGWDDLLYLPELRTVTIAKGVEWPVRLRKYVVEAHANANVGTYFDHQVE